MGFNLGAFAGGAAKGYSEGLENQRKQGEEKRRQDQADWEKKRRDDQEAFNKEAMETFFPNGQPTVDRASPPAANNPQSVVKVNNVGFGPSNGIAAAMPATPSAQDRLMPDSTEPVTTAQDGAPKSVIATGVSLPKPKTDDAQQATQGWGDAFAKNPDLFGDPETMLKLGKLAMKYNQPDALAWLERGHKAYKENAIAALQRLAAGDVDGAEEAYNKSGKGRVKINREQNPDGSYSVTELTTGTKHNVNALPELKSYLSPDHYFKMLNDERQLAEHERHNKEGEKSQGKIIEETRRHNVVSEGIALAKAKESGEGTTSEIKNVTFLIKNGVAKTPQEAWEMVKTGKTPAGEQVHFGNDGSVAIANRDSGRITKYDEDGKEVVIRPGKGAAPGADAPPIQGAKKAPDGKWYVKGADGKYSRVD